ncbi:MAG: heparinase II/III family protein [Clostridia bacterium]|nr:heparinase II/III family protein [Clostridia bacterium]
MIKKILSLLLIFTLSVSMLVIPAYATEASADSQATVADETPTVKNYVHFHQTFGDAVDDYGNLGNISNSVNSTLTTKLDSDGNHYTEYFIDGVGNVFFQIGTNTTYSPSTSALGYLVLEFDINDLGNLVYTKDFVEMISGSTTRKFATNVININNDGTTNYIYAFNNKSNRADISLGEWNHVRLEFSILSPSATTYTAKVIVGDKSFSTTYNLGTPATINYFRIGSTTTPSLTLGFDNIDLYSCKELLDGYEQIGTVSDLLAMKVGTVNAYHMQNKITIANEPILVDSIPYAPVEAVKLFAPNVLTDEHFVDIDGVSYVSVYDIEKSFGEKAKYDDMGLILIGDGSELLDRNEDINDLVNLMKRFIFDLPSAESLKEDVATYTGGEHPYLMADTDKFTYLRTIYNNGLAGNLTNEEEKTLYGYISAYMKTAQTRLNTYASIDSSGNYTGLRSRPKNNNYTTYQNNGYDIGGRLSVPADVLYYFAFAYQMTGNINYAKVAYDYQIALGEWNHWGPAHFLNCADASAPFAVAYDWLYNAYEELRLSGEIAPENGEVYDQAILAEILLTHTIIPGLVQSKAIVCPWPNNVVDSRYATKESNWNAVCTSGVVAAALAIMGQDISTEGMTYEIQKKDGNGGFTSSVVAINSIGNTSIHLGLETISDYAAQLMSMNLYTMMTYGLAQYVPDGSYIESAGYWSYGTNTFFRMVAMLVSATGDDYGFMDAWGIDKTSYFAIHVESSDYRSWSYHDGGTSSMDISYSLFVGDFYDDINLSRVRKKQLQGGKSCTLQDILYYDTSITGEPELTLDYHMAGIDAFATRSSWDKGALYAGIIGGNNSVSHGQIDAGSFVYHNGGNIWFHDLGSDNYNYSGGYFGNYNLYVQSAEGHNVICLVDETDIPYGQERYSSSPITETCIDGDNGSFAIINTAPAYGSHVVSAKRGMLLTESRDVTVIQDEITFSGAKTAYWFGHYNVGDGFVDYVRLSADGRTAYMVQDDQILRVSILCENQDVVFELMDCYTYVLDGTIVSDRETMGGALTEKSRDSYGKLAIKFENVESINLAVVIEPVTTYTAGCSYEWTDMADWSVAAKETPEKTQNIYIDFDNVAEQKGTATLVDGESAYATAPLLSASNTYLSLRCVNTKSTATDAYFNFNASRSNPIDLKFGKYVSFDMDVFTDHSLPRYGSIVIGATTSDGTKSNITLTSFDGKSAVIGGQSYNTGLGWVHLTAILDVNANVIYLYIDGVPVGTIENAIPSGTVSLDNIAIKLPTPYSSSSYASINVDNISVTTYGTSFDGTELASVLSSGADITEWSDAVYKGSSIEAPAPLAECGTEKIYTYSALEDAIADGKGVKLLRDITLPVSIKGSATIDTSGYNFNFSSSQFIADINGNVITFSTGSITVVWHVGDTTYTQEYTSSRTALFVGTDASVGKITEVVSTDENGVEKYTYYTTGWASSKDGTPLSAEEMLVTKSNREFWLVDTVPADLLYVTRSDDGRLAGGTTEAGLRTAISSLDSSHKNIILCKDVTFTQQSLINISRIGKMIYLNGFTMTSTSDKHWFYFGSSTADTHFIGPGRIEKNTTFGAILTTDGSASSTTVSSGVIFRDVTIINNQEIVDTRSGHHYFIDCTIIQSTSDNKRPMFQTWNKNSGYESDGVTPLNYTSLTFDGCDISRNCPATLVSQIFSGTGGYVEYNVVDTTITNGTLLFSAGDVNSLLDISGSSCIKATGIMKPTAEFAVKIGEGVKLSFIPDAKHLEEDTAVVLSGDVDYPYIVSSDWTTVNWLDLSGNTLASETFAVGATPTPMSETVISYLADLYTSTAKEYGYVTSKLTVATVASFSPTEKPVSGVLYNLNIHSSFDINLYIPADTFTLYVDGDEIDLSALEVMTVDGVEYYLYNILDIYASDAGRSISVRTVNASGDVEKIISVVEHLGDLLSSDQPRMVKNLAANTLNYITSVYEYCGMNNTSEYYRASEIAEAYVNYASVFSDIEESYSDTASISYAISSARIRMLSVLGFRFTLNPEFTGMITVNTASATYHFDVYRGHVDSKAYVDVFVSAHEFSDDVTITVGEDSITYSLDIYGTAVSGRSISLGELIFCINNYILAAKHYAEAIK